MLTAPPSSSSSSGSAVPAAIDTMPTPNPDALMFRLQEMLVPTGTFEYRTAAQASDAPLPRRLFDLGGIVQVLVAPRFVTVNKDADLTWPELVPQIKAAIRDFLDSGDMAVPDEDLAVSNYTDPVERKIVRLLDEMIRPAVAGGSVFAHATTKAGRMAVREKTRMGAPRLRKVRKLIKRLLSKNVRHADVTDQHALRTARRYGIRAASPLQAPRQADPQTHRSRPSAPHSPPPWRAPHRSGSATARWSRR